MNPAPSTALTPAEPAGADAEPLLSVRDLRVTYRLGGGVLSRNRGEVRAVDGVSFDVRPGTTFGIVGESGCGKSTTGRAIMRLTQPTGGEVRFRGEDLAAAKAGRMRELRRSIQMVFQDPYSSLNPRMRIIDSIVEPMDIHGYLPKEQRFERALTLLERVGLRADHLYRFPHEFSGGQRQRIGLARALALDPELIIADEPVSALDVSVQAQVLNLLRSLQAEFGLTYVFISHDMSVVRYLADDIGVMYLGRIVESGRSEDVFANPQHPYTQALLSAVPSTNTTGKRERIMLSGDLPSPKNPPSGCVFSTRCPVAMPICSELAPELRTSAGGQAVACHRVDGVAG